MAELWGPIDVAAWKAVPCVSGRLATEDDVRAGRAVFYIHAGIGATVGATPVPIPCRAFQIQSTEEVPVIVIQAESVDGKTAVGIRYLAGGNGVCLLEELRVVPDHDDRFPIATSG